MRFLKNILFFWLLIASLYAKSNNQEKLDFQISRFLKSENETFKYTVLHKIDTILQSFNKDTILFNWEWLAANCENNEYNRCAG